MNYYTIRAVPYDPQRHHRRSVRLPGYDYTLGGAYFITICVQGQECLLGEVAEGELRLGPLGELAAACWDSIPRHFPNAKLDAMVVMPNHIHGIVILRDAGAKHHDASPLQQERARGTARGSLPAIVQNFKSVSTRKINYARTAPGARLWQRNYYEHIIRSEAALYRIRDYIIQNPARWPQDRLHPSQAERPNPTRTPPPPAA